MAKQSVEDYIEEVQCWEVLYLNNLLPQLAFREPLKNPLKSLQIQD